VIKPELKLKSQIDKELGRDETSAKIFGKKCWTIRQAQRGKTAEGKRTIGKKQHRKISHLHPIAVPKRQTIKDRLQFRHQPRLRPRLLVASATQEVRFAHLLNIKIKLVNITSNTFHLLKFSGRLIWTKKEE
jgi:hypothetical protein